MVPYNESVIGVRGNWRIKRKQSQIAANFNFKRIRLKNGFRIWYEYYRYIPLVDE